VKSPDDRKGLTSGDGELDVDVEGDDSNMGLQETSFAGSRSPAKGGYSQVTSDADLAEL